MQLVGRILFPYVSPTLAFIALYRPLHFSCTVLAHFTLFAREHFTLFPQSGVRFFRDSTRHILYGRNKNKKASSREAMTICFLHHSTVRGPDLFPSQLTKWKDSPDVSYRHLRPNQRLNMSSFGAFWPPPTNFFQTYAPRKTRG